MTAQPKAVASAAPARPRTPLKIEQTLALLIEADRDGRYLTALDALNSHGDSCWHTSVATCRAKGLEFVQRSHPHQSQSGAEVRFQAYRLAEGHREKAERLLAQYRAREESPRDG